MLKDTLMRLDVCSTGQLTFYDSHFAGREEINDHYHGTLK